MASRGQARRGGFGAVFRAVHPVIGKHAAIKVLSRQFSANPQRVSRFIAEARAVNQIRHRNIIDIFAFGQLPDGRQYYVMELLDGTPFDRYLASQKRLSLAQAHPILRGLARELDRTFVDQASVHILASPGPLACADVAFNTNEVRVTSTTSKFSAAGQDVVPLASRRVRLGTGLHRPYLV